MAYNTLPLYAILERLDFPAGFFTWRGWSVGETDNPAQF